MGARYTDLDDALEDISIKDTGWNEASGRYIAYQGFWTPEYFRLAPENKKQGSIDTPHPNSNFWRGRYMEYAEQGHALYAEMVADGVAPEQARALLGLNSYTSWYWTASFQAVAHFVNLRDHPEAQKEIKEYAIVIDGIMSELYPVSWAQRKGLN